jgi:hypothetical protein
MNVKAFKKMEDPIEKNKTRTKYICYVQCDTIPEEIYDWMAVNPRERKMTTDVAKKISESLERNDNFHELNRGILLSAESVVYDNQKNEMTVEFTDPEKHGNIDGGHTLRAILDKKLKNTLDTDRYVFVEIITGIDSPVSLAEARNTSVQVDLKSIEELNKSFDVLKNVFSDLPFRNRIQYKMNEHYNEDDIVSIDVREVIAITLMFSQAVYPKRNSDNTFTDTHPIQCYSGKEASLRKFLNLGKEKRDEMLQKMKPIIKDIFKLWNTIECEFATKGLDGGKRYGTRKYSKYDGGKIIDERSVFDRDQLRYYVPKGLVYPLVGAFRSLVEIDDSGNYSWKRNPKTVWDDIGARLVNIILEEKTESPDVLAKNTNLWSNLFKEVFINAYL